MLTVITRFAPSPTGLLHVGNYRTAVFAYLFARHEGGKFLLRIEDTDKARFKKEYQENILESLKWLGLSYDEMFVQSDNVKRHTEVLEKLIADGHAYVSKEEAKDGSGEIKEVVRFKNPGGPVTFHDLIRGEITTDTTDLGDFVIARSITEPLFHLAVVVDDLDMGITHVIRGDDHIANTPRQLLILRAMGGKDFIYAHLPLVFGADKQKLSKRRGALAITEYRDAGYLPETLLNFMALMGWNPGGEQEIFSLEELEKLFDLSRVQKSPAIFNVEKLDWMNREYIKKLSSVDFWRMAENFVPQIYRSEKEILQKLEPVIRDRISKFSDIQKMFEEGELGYFFEKPKYDNELLVWKKSTKEKTKKNIEELLPILESVKNWTKEGIETAVMPYAEKEGKGDVLWPMRAALSGREKSPDPFTLAAILGKKETLSRLEAAGKII